MRISDWSSDVCSSDLGGVNYTVLGKWAGIFAPGTTDRVFGMLVFRYPESPFKTPISDDDKRKLTASMFKDDKNWHVPYMVDQMLKADDLFFDAVSQIRMPIWRSEEHTSELQSLMRISYAVFCLKQKTYHHAKYSLH